MSDSAERVTELDAVSDGALEKLLELGQSVIDEDNPANLLERIVATAGTALDADIVVLYEYREDTADVDVPPVRWGTLRFPKVLEARSKAQPHRSSAVFKMLERAKPFYARDARRDWAEILDDWPHEDSTTDNFVLREGIASSAAIPLKAQDNLVGVLFVNYRKQRSFSRRERTTIELFSAHAAAGLLRARQMKDLERTNAQLRALSRIGHTLSTCSRDEVLEIIYQQTSQLMDTDNFFISLYDPAHEELHFEYWMYKGERWGRFSNRLGGLTGFVIEEKKPVLIRDWDVEENGFSVKADIVTGRQRSWLGVPLLVGDEVRGVISVQSGRRNAFDEESQQILQIIAAQAAVVIENARLLEEAQHKVGFLAALHATSIDITQQRELDQLMVSIITRASDLLAGGQRKGMGAAYWRVDHETQTATIAYSPNPDFLGVTVGFETGLIGDVIRTGKGKYVNDYLGWPGSANVFLEGRLRGQVENIVEVPIKSQGKVIGVLAVSDATGERLFTDADIDVLERFADLAVIAMDNAQLLADLQRQVRGHKVLNRIGTDLVGILDEDKLLETVASVVADALDCTHCSVFRVEAGQLVIRAAQGEWAKYLHLGRTFELGQGIAGWVALEEEPTLVQDSTKDPRFEQGWSGHGDPQSLVAVPIILDGVVCSVVSAEQNRAGAFDEHDLQLLQTLAMQTSQAIRNARLYAELQEQVARLETLNRVGMELSAALDAESVFQTAVKAVVDTLDCTHCTVFEVRDKWVVPRASHTQGKDIRITRRFALGKGLAGWVAQNGLSVLTADAREERRFARGKTNPNVDRSLAVVPIVIEDRVVGVIAADQDRKNAFTEADLQIVETLALQTGITLQKAMLVDEERHRADVMHLLRKVSTSISATLDVAQTLDLIVKGAISLTHGDSSIIYLIDEANEISHRHAFPETFRHPRTRFSERQGLTWRVFRSRRDIEIRDVKRSKQASDELKQAGVRSLIGVPLKVGEEVVGILFCNSSQRSAFGDEDKALLIMLAEQAAMAVKKARLFEELGDRVDDLAALNRISHGLGSAEPLALHDMAELLHRECSDRKLMNLEHFYVASYDPEENLVRFEFVVDDGMEIEAGEHEWAPRVDGNGLTEYVARAGSPLYIPDDVAAWRKRNRVTDGLRGGQEWDELLVSRDPSITGRSWLGIPIKIGDQVAGVIVAQSYDEPNAYDKHDEQVLSTIARQLGIAIVRLRLAQSKEDLEAKVRQLESAQAKIHQLERARAMVGIASIFVHRISNMGGTIPPRVKYALAALESYPEARKEVQPYFDGIMQDMKDLVAATEELQNTAKEAPRPEWIDVSDLLMSVARQVRLRTPESFEVDYSDVQTELPRIRATALELEEAIRNVVDNAIEAMSPEGGRLRLSATVDLDERGKRWIRLAVEDDGHGIPEDLKPRVFDLYVTSKPQGLGYGLWRSKSVVEMLGGTVEIDSEVDRGTKVVIRLPVADSE